jgi:putative flavoprotein involved in K+ transport
MSTGPRPGDTIRFIRPQPNGEEMATHSIPRSVDTAIVGAGQAGLAMSWFLRGAGREHVLLERREQLGGSWPDRWDDFCLVSPNWTVSLPGYPYDGRNPDGFMARDEIAARIAGYAAAIDAPVVLGTDVNRLSKRAGGDFLLETSGGSVTARQIVVATGGFQIPKVPAMAAALPHRLAQLHTHNYTREDALPPGAVLVVGSGQSGVQIAEELHASGRHVYLSVGTAGRVPRRYRGQDTFLWLVQLERRGAEFEVPLPTVKTLPDPRMRFAANPHVSGHGGGHDTNLRLMAYDGITLLGHLEGVDGDRLRLRPDLAMNLAFADHFFDARLRPLIDPYIERAGIVAPPDDRQPVAFEPPETVELNLARAGITSVVWASGYRTDFGWLDIAGPEGRSILDEYGMPRQDRGVSEVSGLYFLGLPWLNTILSSSLMGVGPDSRHLAERMGLIGAAAVESPTA